MLYASTFFEIFLSSGVDFEHILFITLIFPFLAHSALVVLMYVLHCSHATELDKKLKLAREIEPPISCAIFSAFFYIYISLRIKMF